MSTRTIDYYEILGVSRNATPEEIKMAFRKLAKIWHPDRHVGESPAEIKHAEYMFKLVHEAYEYLMNGDPQDEYQDAGAYDENPVDEDCYAGDFSDTNELENMSKAAQKVVFDIIKWLLIVAAVIVGLIMVAKAVMCIFHILLPLLIIGGVAAVAYFAIAYFLF